MNAIDTNIFAYTFDPSVPDKQAVALDLLRELALHPPDSLLLWQVAVEFLACLRKAVAKGLITSEEMRDRFDAALRVFPIVLPTIEIFHRSFLLHDRYSLSHWDSLLIAASKMAGATTLYSEDMQHGADYDGVKIINPFV